MWFWGMIGVDGVEKVEGDRWIIYVKRRGRKKEVGYFWDYKYVDLGR